MSLSGSLLFLALLFQGELRVEGLAPGERARTLAADPGPRAASGLELHAVGRVVDATDGAPLVGVSVEAWTEEIDRAARGFRRVGEATSGRDGTFRVRVRAGGLAAEKVRLRAAGYLTFAGTVGDLDLVRLVPRGIAPRLEIVDLEDRPIAGARITTTYSCAHDLAAFEVHSDALGRAELPEYGLQDHVGELRLRAAGFGAVKYLDASSVLPDLERAASGAPARLRLPRREALRARVLGIDGRPLARATLHVIEGDGYHVPTTDEEGLFELPSCYGGLQPTIQVLEPDRDRHVYSGRLPVARAVTLRVGAEDVPEDGPTGRLRVALETRGAGEGTVPLQLFHEEGWTTALEVDDGEAELDWPPGAAALLVGGRFSGWEERLLELELVEGELTRLDVLAVAEPLLTILTPPGETSLLLVQVGADSIEVEPDADGRTRVRVPGGRSVTLLARGERTRRLALGVLDSDGVADLGPEARLLPPDLGQLLRERPRDAVLVHVLDLDGAPLEGARLSVSGAGEPVVLKRGGGVFQVEGPRGFGLLVRAGAEGHAARWERVTPVAGGPPRVLTPTPLAAVEIEAPFSFEVARPFDEGLERLHPGPLDLLLELEDGRRLALALELAPGETRRLILSEAP